MSEPLPVDWEHKPIKELAQVVSGGTPSRNVAAFWENGTITWVTPTDITAVKGKYLSETKERITQLGLQSSAATLMQAGAILMTSRATLGESRISTIPACTNQGFKSLVAKPGVSAEFLYYQMLRTKEKYARFGSGSTFLEVGKKDTDRFQVAVAPYPYQQEISKILSTIDAQIEVIDRLITKQGRVRAGLLQDLFTRGVDEHGTLRPPRNEAAHLYHETKLGWLPIGWEVGPLLDYAGDGLNSFVNGPFGSDLLSSELRIEGVPVIYVRDISDMRYRRVSTVCVDPRKAAQLAFCLVKPGDVLIAKVGDPPCMAAPYLEEEVGIVTQDVMRIHPSLYGESVFISSLINSQTVRSLIRRIMVEGTRSRVSLTDLKRLLVPKLSPSERKMISSVVSVLDQTTESLKQQLSVEPLAKQLQELVE